MARHTLGHFAKKHPEGATPDPRIADALATCAREKGLDCVAAFKLARTASISPQEVGRSADLMEIPVVRCQLGLFGHHPEKRIVKPLAVIPTELRAAIERNLVDNRLPCSAAFRIAEGLHLAKMKVAAACETLKIKVSHCQLGAF